MRKSFVAILALVTGMCLVASINVRAQDVPGEWVTYRGGIKRTGNQAGAGLMLNLGNPAQVRGNWAMAWQFPNQNVVLPAASPLIQDFIASPVVSNGVAYIGNTNGVFYAINMQDGSLKWFYPDPPRDPNGPKAWAFRGSCEQWGQYGIRASAAITNINGEQAIIFGAPDPDPDPRTDVPAYGSARLWAIDANDGHLIWRSEVVARVTGCTPGAFPPPAPSGDPTEYHETLHYSSPLILMGSPPNAVYVGIDSNEAPIQQGAVKYVELSSGKALSPFFTSEPNGQVGGDVWNAPASDGLSVYFTTGNERQWNAVTPSQQPQPNPHYGLSMVRTDLSGSLAWFFQPLPFNLDNDPDWNAGATVMDASCGTLVVSVMKDGWSYALAPYNGSCVWQFPDMGNPGCKFPSNDNHYHGGSGFRVPGAAWGDVLVIATGGYALPSAGSATNPDLQQRLHALDVCLSSSRGTMPRVRWLAQSPATSSLTAEDAFGAPTIINGIVYVPTNLGHVLAYADSSVIPQPPSTCDNPEFSAQDCVAMGGTLVPVASLLNDFSLPDGGDAARLRKEVVLAEGLALVATSHPLNAPPNWSGHVYALKICPNCSSPPICSASTDCTGELTISCSGPDVGVVFNGNCKAPTGEPTPCYAGFTGASTVTAGGNVDWIGSTTSPNVAEACTENSAGETCIYVTAPVPAPCPPAPTPPAPRCGMGEKWCLSLTPPACAPIRECLFTPPKPPTP